MLFICNIEKVTKEISLVLINGTKYCQYNISLSMLFTFFLFFVTKGFQRLKLGFFNNIKIRLYFYLTILNLFKILLYKIY